MSEIYVSHLRWLLRNDEIASQRILQSYSPVEDEWYDVPVVSDNAALTLELSRDEARAVAHHLTFRSKESYCYASLLEPLAEEVLSRLNTHLSKGN